ncbi:MAG: MazG family protein [Hydrocarboniphaga effusa]|nr:MazG family protein [Hydrocarboniphaga effusa]
MTRETLREAAQVQRKASRQGFDWPRNDPRLWSKLAEEIRELRAVRGDRRRAADELGDLLFMVVNLSRHLKVDAPRALSGAVRKFQRRYAYVMRHARELPPLDQPRRLAAMERLWQQAKQKEKGIPRKGAKEKESPQGNSE